MHALVMLLCTRSLKKINYKLKLISFGHTESYFFLWPVSRLPNRPVINTAIVSTTVHSEGPPLPPILDPPIILEYTLLETEERTKPVCVFWNHSIA